MTGKSSAITLVGTAYYKGFRMAVLHGSDDRFFAVRSDAPYFCFEGASEQEVISAASEVIDAVLAEHPTRPNWRPRAFDYRLRSGLMLSPYGWL